LLFLLLLGGGVAFLIMKKNSANAVAESGAAMEHSTTAEKPALPVYAALDTFTVNLAGDQLSGKSPL
jgi:flagellar basal body-associated protein FliL